MTHTPTPWYTHDKGTHTEIVNNEHGELVIAEVYSADDAAFIVRACNSHDALVEALERLLSFDCVRWLNDRGPIGEGWQSDELIAAIAAADEAIAKARGEVSQ